LKDKEKRNLFEVFLKVLLKVLESLVCEQKTSLVFNDEGFGKRSINSDDTISLPHVGGLVKRERNKRAVAFTDVVEHIFLFWNTDYSLSITENIGVFIQRGVVVVEAVFPEVDTYVQRKLVKASVELKKAFVIVVDSEPHIAGEGEIHEFILEGERESLGFSHNFSYALYDFLDFFPTKWLYSERVIPSPGRRHLMSVCLIISPL